MIQEFYALTAKVNFVNNVTRLEEQNLQGMYEGIGVTEEKGMPMGKEGLAHKLKISPTGFVMKKFYVFRRK